MAKAETGKDEIAQLLERLNTRIEDLFILEAARAGIRSNEIRSILGIGMNRVTKITKYVKKDEQ